MDGALIRQLGIDVIERESAAVASLAGQLDESFERTVQILLECQGKVLVSGSGTSHAVALRFAHLLSLRGHAGPLPPSRRQPARRFGRGRRR